MTSRYRRLSEVAQPAAGDEINFKEKHVIDHILDPNAEEEQFTADSIKKFKNRADYKKGDDVAVYEGVTLVRRDLPGQEDEDINNDGTSDAKDSLLAYRRHAMIKNRIIDEQSEKMTDAQLEKREEIIQAMKKDSDALKKRYGKQWQDIMYAIATKKAMAESFDPVGQEDEDVDNDGKVTNTDRYLLARRRAISRKLQQEGLMDVIQPVGGEYGDEEKSHVAYKKKNKSRPEHTGEPIEVKEERLDEISSKVLRSYLKKAERSYDSHLNKASRAGRLRDATKDRSEKEELQREFMKHANKAEKRINSMAKADEKLSNEGVSMIRPEKGLRIYAGNTKRNTTESFGTGRLELADGKTLYVTEEQALLLNSLLDNLSESNVNKMYDLALMSEDGFNSVVEFAKEVM